MTRKEKYDYRRENGLCVRCGGVNDRDASYCSACKERIAERRQMYQTLKICPNCKTNKLYGDEKICPECLAKAQIANKTYRDNNPEQIKHNNAVGKEKRKAIREERKANHQCSLCGRMLPYQYTHLTCTRCRHKNAEMARNRGELKIIYHKDTRYSDEHSRCQNCYKNERYGRYKICKDCYDKLMIARDRSVEVRQAKEKWRWRDEEHFSRIANG